MSKKVRQRRKKKKAKHNKFPPIDILPNEIFTQIFEQLYVFESQLGYQGLFSCLLVNRRWYTIALPLLWKSINIVAYPGHQFDPIHDMILQWREEAFQR